MNGAVVAYVALGANLGNAGATILKAMEQLGALPQSRVTRRSSLYRTAPIESVGPDFVNAVVELVTQLAPLELLDALQAFESQAGRVRPYRNAPRTLDLDVLLYGDLHLTSERLQIPHPRMNERAFVLVPLAEIAPQRVSANQLMAVSAQAVERIPAG